jgi:hypothetical protein
MFDRTALGILALVVALAVTATGAAAFDDAKYPDWGGQWKRPRGVGTQWDQTKPAGIAQQAPRRDRKELWQDYNCDEANNHVVVGKENYFLSGDGYLMPTKKDQPPPDLRYFKQAGK